MLENTRAANSSVAAPVLYLACLLRHGQVAKAAREVHVQRIAAAGEEAPLNELTAALALAAPEVVPTDSTWALWQSAALAALNAWCADAPPETVEQHLVTLPLRSPFGPFRLILKALAIAHDVPEKAEELLARAPAAGPFGAFAEAARLALCDEAQLLARWRELGAAQRHFVADLRGMAPDRAAALSQIEEAERHGPAALLAALLRRPPGLPVPALRAACLELLARVPGQSPQVERAFGPLTRPERERALALAAEEKADWAGAMRRWQSVAESLSRSGERLAAGVAYRHLAELAQEHGAGSEQETDRAITTALERSLNNDAAHLPTALRLIRLHRTQGRSREWYAAVDRTLACFPAEPAVLGEAVDAAVERKAWKKASGYARMVLRLDPINQSVRERMIGLDIAQARKQMQAGRADLARQVLADAAEWQRADAPDAGLSIAQGLVGLRLGQGDQAASQLSEGVRLAGGDVAGWFQAALEARLMGLAEGDGAAAGQELAQEVRSLPEREQVMALAGLLDRSEETVSPRVLAPLVRGVAGWLGAGARLEWAAGEFVSIADVLLRFRLFPALKAYAREEARRRPREVMAPFFAIAAAAQGNAARLTAADEEQLETLLERAHAANDGAALHRIHRFLNSGLRSRVGRSRASGRNDEELAEMLEAILEGLPGIVPQKRIRRMVKEVGRDETVASIEEVFQDSPFAVLLTPAQLRGLAERAVAAALSPGGRR